MSLLHGGQVVPAGNQKTDGDEFIPPDVGLMGGEWQVLGSLYGWKTAQDKANNQNATFGVLSALLITLSFPIFIAAPDFGQFADENGLSPCGVDTEAVSMRPMGIGYFANIRATWWHVHGTLMKYEDRVGGLLDFIHRIRSHIISQLPPTIAAPFIVRHLHLRINLALYG